MLEQPTHIVKYVLQNTQPAQHLRKRFQTSVIWLLDSRYDWCPTGCESIQHGAFCTEKLQIITVKRTADLDKWSAMGKGDRSLFVTSNQRIPLKNTIGCSAVVCCACEIIQFFSVVFCVVRDVRKFELGLVVRGGGGGK
jgi:hypothetical protein